MDPDRLATIDVFAALSDESVRRLATFATETSVPAGQVLVREGDYAYGLMAIQEGEARVVREGKQIATLGPGEVFGERALLEHGPRTATVEATTPMRLATFTIADLRRAGAGIDIELDAVLERREGAQPAV